ncbi:hypothetical protein J2Z22_000910 [Paenibacillus forsythiae]|uniref:Transmembrane protein n=1 Tax=Paenibacillus forsythiae TaxID=365616 RepID=A0ABU3H3J9_9BACL|nr:hypothetical protein [Paenibacillus forsythiae]MDT3425394.1 hypothetical protein [Paenibacillus forsythiae]
MKRGGENRLQLLLLLNSNQNINEKVEKMKKVFGMSISFVLVFAIMLLPSVALADPAPHLLVLVL